MKTLHILLFSLALMAVAIPPFRVAAQSAPTAPPTPAVGEQVPDFTLKTPSGATVQLKAVEAKGRTVLVLLRGYPGYQCPFCMKQVHDFAEHSQAFADKNVTVLLVYPGPPASLDERAREFLAKQAALPANILLVTDPDYKMTNLYGLRWNAPRETAYPATFLLDVSGRVMFEKVSHDHGDRTAAQDILNLLPARTP